MKTRLWKRQLPLYLIEGVKLIGTAHERAG